MLQPISRVVDLLDPALNRISNMTSDQARARVLAGNPAGVLGIVINLGARAAERKVLFWHESIRAEVPA